MQNPVSTRLAAPATVTIASGGNCNALPALSSLGGDAFLAVLAATLNVYKDRIDNAACASATPDYLDTLVRGLVR